MNVAFQFSAAGQQVWTAELAGTITAVGAIGAGTLRGILSGDPAATTAAFTAPSANSADKNLLAYASGGAPPEITKIPISAGERILVAASAAGTIVLTFETF